MSLTNQRYRTSLLQEFDRQAENLLQKGYPEAAALPPREFMMHIESLRRCLDGLDAPETDMEAGRLPFVIAIKSVLVTPETAMSLAEREGKRGFVKMYPREPDEFRPIEGVSIPSAMAYLIVDVNRGGDSINVTPNEALTMIETQGRSPLTIDEGVAVLTHYPDFLRKNACYSLLGSRAGDQRVPAIWISEGRPRLGWCWAGNPHTWLGSASCRGRIGP